MVFILAVLLLLPYPILCDLCRNYTACGKCVAVNCVWCSDGGCFDTSDSWPPCDSSNLIYASSKCPIQDPTIYFVIIALGLAGSLFCMCLCRHYSMRSHREAQRSTNTDYMSTNVTPTQSILPSHSATIEVSEKKSVIPPPQKDPVIIFTEPLNEAFARLLCDICSEKQKDIALGCGHMLCEDCIRKLSFCPFCKAPIKSAQRVYL